MRIFVLFNCQAKSLARCLEAMAPGTEAVGHIFDPARDKPKFPLLRKDLSKFDRVVTLPTMRELVLRENLAAAGKLVVMPAFSFAGLHPDTLFLAGQHATPGPTARMHSRIALAGFLAGLDVADTVSLYNTLVFARLGYFDAFAPQWRLLLDHFARHDYAIEAALTARMAEGPLCHTPLHPTLPVIWDMARLLAVRLGLVGEPTRDPPASIEDMLGKLPAHPIFPEVAARHGARGGGVWRAGGGAHKAGPLSLEGFVAASFALYAAAPPNRLLRSPSLPQALEALGLRAATALPDNG